MEWEKYSLTRSSNGFEYKFHSEGSKGIIIKIIEFQPMPELGRNVFNLAFGDYNATKRRFDDKAVSDNGDWERVLHTVADAIHEFMKGNPLAIIMIKGSTPSRVRLYQMGIASFWPTIREYYDVLGKTVDQWLPFQRGINFEEFVVLKKKE